MGSTPGVVTPQEAVPRELEFALGVNCAKQPVTANTEARERTIGALEFDSGPIGGFGHPDVEILFTAHLKQQREVAILQCSS